MKVNIKILIVGFFASLLFFTIPIASQADSANNLVTAYLFYGDGCGFCAQEQDFMHNDLKPRYPNLEIKEYEIYKNRPNGLFLQQIGKELDVDIPGVPFLVVGDKPFVGYMAGVTSKDIEKQVELCSSSGCPDTVASLAPGYNDEHVGDAKPPLVVEGEPEDEVINDEELTKDLESELSVDRDSSLATTEDSSTESPLLDEEDTEEMPEEKMINLPLLGEVDALSFSLPALTIIIGILDGFNPCAMWVLLFLISLLLGMKSRKRMWVLGLTFIVASAAVYFIFMSAWLNLILFLGFIVWVRIGIALIALLGGAYSLRDFFVNKNAACKVGDPKKKQKTFARLKKAAYQNSIWLALAGIIALAFAVNLVELICSAGFPAVYTQVLALSNLPSWKNYLYILLYIFFFMLDDLIIFFIAMTTLKATGITTKYSRASRLIGGILMLIIGILLLFRPEWLMFG